MSKQWVWEADTPEGYRPRCSLAMVKQYPNAPVYILATVYVPAVQERLRFLPALTGLHNLQIEAVALIYMPKNCIYMPEPSTGDHYTLLPLAGGKNICMGALSSFVAAKLMVSSTHSSSGMGVHLKLPGRFSPDLDSDGLISEPALCHGPIWKNANFIVWGDDRRPVLVNGDPVVMESLIKVAPVDQYTPLNCTALTNVGYEPKFTNDAFAFKETVAEMWQCLDRTKAEAAEQKPPEPMITDEHHQEALAATQAPMYASKTSNITVALIPDVEFIDAAKDRSFLGIKQDKGEEVATTSVGSLAQSPQDSAAIKATPTPAKTTTGAGDARSPLDPTCLCEALGQMNNSLEHLEWGYFDCFHETVKATWEVLADLNEVDATYVDTVLMAMGKWQKSVTLTIADMHTDNCVVWDAKRNAIDEATQEFGEMCEASRIKRANAREANEPMMVPCVPAEHLPLLVSNAYNTVSQFRMTIWWMVADECIMPMWHDYLMNFGLATVMQHTLEKVPSTCMRIMPPCPPEPKDNLTAFLDSLGNTSASHMPVTPLVPPTMVPPVKPAVLPPVVTPLPRIPASGNLGMGPVPATTFPVRQSLQGSCMLARGVCQNRYAMDWPKMRDYHQNYLMETNQKTFNLKNHSKYLNIILLKPGITRDVVFTTEAGRAYFAKKHKVLTDLYNQGLLTPLPAVPGSKWFPDKEVMAIIYVMVIVACPSSQNIADDDPNGFGRMCLMGLWGLHKEKVLQRCCKICADGVNRITVGFCPFCEFWTMNDSMLNNHVHKHYGMVMSCYHDGYTTRSMMAMKHHMTTKHIIVMESAPEKCKRTK